MQEYKVIGIDLAKTKFHIAALDKENKVVLKKMIRRKEFIEGLEKSYSEKQCFAFEACAGAHYIGQELMKRGHEVIMLKAKDVKAYAKARQKNDINDAIAICKAALDPELKRVRIKSKEEQEISYLHKSRSNVIAQRIEKSNSLITSLQEFGYIVECVKASFAKQCEEQIEQAYQKKWIGVDVYEEMLKDCADIKGLMQREKELERTIIAKNKENEKAQILLSIPGIGPINASVLSNKGMDTYDSARDFAASLGLVPKQNTTGGQIKLGSITKQGDRYARTMLIQGARTIVMRCYKANPPDNALYQFAQRLLEKGKRFNVVCVALANKLARIAYACVMNGRSFNPQ